MKKKKKKRFRFILASCHWFPFFASANGKTCFPSSTCWASIRSANRVLGLAVDGLMTKPHGTSDAESGRTPYRVIPGFKNFFTKNTRSKKIFPSKFWLRTFRRFLCVLSIIYMSNNPDGEYCPMSQAIRGDAEKKEEVLSEQKQQ